ncbi:MAG: polysaccharide biosynthesis/export family protein [Vitreimonas sp.]
MISGSIRGLVAAALLLLCACGTGGGPVRQRGDAQPPAIDLATEYRLGPGDRLRIAVFGETELTGEFVVNSLGAISYPLVGSVPAQGKTIPEFTDSLGALLRDGYVRQPLITVEVLNYRPYYILGEVTSPGTYAYIGGLTVMNAVATAGGFTYRANTRQVFIRHAGADNEAPVVLTSDTLVQPGDTIRIPERRF